jgi:hypothetical protein
MIPNRGVQMTVDGWNNALYRVWLDRIGEHSAVNSWVSAYGVAEALVTDFDARMRREIERMAAVAVA